MRTDAMGDDVGGGRACQDRVNTAIELEVEPGVTDSLTGRTGDLGPADSVLSDAAVAMAADQRIVRAAAALSIHPLAGGAITEMEQALIHATNVDVQAAVRRLTETDMPHEGRRHLRLITVDTSSRPTELTAEPTAGSTSEPTVEEPDGEPSRGEVGA